MTLKTTWTTGQSFAASDQNAVAVDVNAATTKLATITSGATVNDSDANLKNRANHTGVQTSSSISDFVEAAQDAVAAMLAQGTAITMSYNDAANTLTINSTGGGGGGGLDAEAVRDAIGVAMVGTGVITVTVNDAADTITISSTATANDTDANLKARGNHTGTQSADTIVDGSTNHVFTVADDTKLTGIATGATANSSDAALLASAASAAATAISSERTAARTLTNARVTPRTGSTTSATAPSINTDNVDVYGLTGQTADITSFTTNLTGTPSVGQQLWIYVVGTGARAITWGASFESGAATLPTTTVTTQRLDVGFVWNGGTNKWRCMATSSA